MELKFIVESLLFTSQKPLSPSEIRDILSKAAIEEGAEEPVRALKKLPMDQIEEALHQLVKEHETAARSFRLVCVAGSWQFVTQPEYGPWLRSLLGVKARPSRLSQPALETLAIIAYRQPITRAEIEQIRGVAADGVISTLKERGLIVEAGRAEVVGRPMQYATAGSFLEYFGLGALDDLPAADELRRIPVQKPESLLTVETTLATAPTAVVPVVESTPEAMAALDTTPQPVQPDLLTGAEPPASVESAGDVPQGS
ncbi:MAG TPA: SMC-Scp complex subunit ScpB [Candidatus Limnocylindria bacterium]|jgi:segregation and condensation protein B|nr:SMC-Scp complex subunit ScpB [Candidatus Limnocylindria bacterium]